MHDPATQNFRCQRESVRDGIGVMRGDSYQRAGGGPDGFQPDGSSRILHQRIKHGKKVFTALPGAVEERLAIHCRLYFYVPISARGAKNSQRSAAQVLVGPRHGKKARLKVEQGFFAGLGPRDGDAVRGREGIAEVHLLLAGMRLGIGATQGNFCQRWALRYCDCGRAEYAGFKKLSPVHGFDFSVKPD